MDNVTQLEIAAEEGTIAPKENPRLYPRLLIGHVGLNRQKRHYFAKIARMGPAGLKAKTEARELLKRTPANYPVRKVNIDGRDTYIHEPLFQAGMQEFRKVFVAEIAKFPEEPTKEQTQGVFATASRAFVTRVVTLMSEKAAALKESIKEMTPETAEPINV
jgi:hypothetical protein